MSTTLIPPAGNELEPEIETQESLQPSGDESLQQSDRDLLREAFSPERLRWSNVDWVVLVWMVVMHAGCLAAPFFFSWAGLGVALVMHWMTASLGICLGYHRYLAHKSMELKKPAEFAVLACGALSAEGSPLTWSSVHRMHHQLSDQPGDPHSPFDGKWWSHLLWLFVNVPKDKKEVLFRRYSPGWAENSMLRFFERTAPWWQVGSGVAALAAGWFLAPFMEMAPWAGAASMFLWGICVRMVFAYHSTWFVNSATHLWGYRNYETRDKSKNLWWVAILAYGEGWHNNHHAHPSVAPAGHRWWEFDITWWSIKALRAVGLAYNVKDKIPTRETKMEG
ncbi:MAG: acyl-CoA desaturase [Planctomycetaceae bacterium]|jgi:sn-2 palmitoyl-lipid 9-desaturase|nr:acyl-CoA desaturase [Planctomycetaceae bacterium]MBT6153364.1 acyl-CoA desaturase [Planctomycetaceae bacterium]MBT6486158.1 acyl-CoA desaturase [Planctomycetaceae bacterium]MBT6494336.1 acyl-CoA desaturase [Planctomycetaceae bacterium]